MAPGTQRSRLLALAKLSGHQKARGLSGVKIIRLGSKLSDVMLIWLTARFSDAKQSDEKEVYEHPIS
jgi:hypothetical protein